MSQMIVVDDVEQGTDEWHLLRAEIPTVSNFSNIVTPTGRKSGAWDTYMNKLLAERICGKADEGFKSDWMKRGNATEPEAVSTYEFIKGVQVTSVGIIYRDERKDVAASPDGLIGYSKGKQCDGGLELKCPSPAIHIGYLIDQCVPAIYQPQVYGSLYLSKLDYWDFMSYHPAMDELIIRTNKDDEAYLEYAAHLDKYLPLFISELKQRHNYLINYSNYGAAA